MIEETGSVSVEYVVVLSVVSVVCSLALIALGVPLLDLFRLQRAVLMLPFP